MKYSIGILTTVTLIAAFVLSGCDSPSNKMENAETSVIEANRDLEIAKSEVEAELRIYRAENANRIMEYNRTIRNKAKITMNLIEKSEPGLKQNLTNMKQPTVNLSAKWIIIEFQEEKTGITSKTVSATEWMILVIH
jgi:hypothetical protein